MNKIIIVLISVGTIILTAFFVFKISVSSAKTEVVETFTEKQIIKATYSDEKGLWPTEFTVNAGTPVHLEVYAEIDGVGCMGSIMVPYLTKGFQNFIKGQTNVFEFTPLKAGVYEITCAMGIPHGSIVVK